MFGTPTGKVLQESTPHYLTGAAVGKAAAASASGGAAPPPAAVVMSLVMPSSVAPAVSRAVPPRPPSFPIPFPFYPSSPPPLRVPAPPFLPTLPMLLRRPSCLPLLPPLSVACGVCVCVCVCVFVSTVLVSLCLCSLRGAVRRGGVHAANWQAATPRST